MDLSPLEKPVSRIRKRPEENQRSKTRHVLYILTFIDFRKSRSSKRKSSPDRKRDKSRDKSPGRGNDRRERRHDNDRRDRDKNRDRDYRDEKGWKIFNKTILIFIHRGESKTHLTFFSRGLFQKFLKLILF